MKDYGNDEVFNGMVERVRNDPTTLDDEDIGMMSFVIEGLEGTPAETDEEEMQIREIFFNALVLLGKSEYIIDLLCTRDGTFAQRALELLKVRIDLDLSALEGVLYELDDEEIAVQLVQIILNLKGYEPFLVRMALVSGFSGVRERVAKVALKEGPNFNKYAIAALTFDVSILKMLADEIREIAGSEEMRNFSDTQIQTWCLTFLRGGEGNKSKE